MSHRYHPRRQSARSRQHWTTAEAARFLQARRDDPLAAIWWLAFDSGIRRSELLQLTWSDVDLGRGTVTIRSSRFGTARTLGLGATTVSALRALAIRQLADQSNAGAVWVGGTPGATGRLVVDRMGRPILPTVLTRAFRCAQEDLGLPTIPFHGLRHTAAGITFTHGASIQAVAERLGHLDATTTLQVWPHLVDPNKDEEHEGGNG